MIEGLLRLHIEGFASLKEVTLEFGSLTVLIGPNGSGKSNILRVLKMLEMLREGFLQQFVMDAGGANALLYYGAKQTKALLVEFELVNQGQEYACEIRLEYIAGDKLHFETEHLVQKNHAQERIGFDFAGSHYFEAKLPTLPASEVQAFKQWLSGLTFFHFHDTSPRSALRTNARLEDDQQLRADGGNLAAYLARLERGETEADTKAWRRIHQLVHRVAPSIKALKPTVMQHSNGSASVRLDWIDDQGERFGVYHLSDGTLRAIALITALAQPTERLPKFMCIDEPELGLHPAAIQLLADLARSVSRHTQILFATQSTAFLDHFEPEEVVVVERRDGASQVKRLDPETLESWLEEYTLSEVFNKGVIGGRP